MAKLTNEEKKDIESKIKDAIKIWKSSSKAIQIAFGILINVTEDNEEDDVDEEVEEEYD